ncbi:MAG: hypothetical protein ABI340_02310 [Nitrososphaera sp.]
MGIYSSEKTYGHKILKGVKIAIKHLVLDLDDPEASKTKSELE